MYITAPPPKTKIVEEYDFSFENGQVLPVTLDKEAGDSVEFEANGLAVMFKLAEKPSNVTVNTIIMAEEITVYTSHLNFITKRSREVVETPLEQKELWQKTVQELSKTIQ